MFSLPSVLALNHLLAGAAWARSRLQPFAGRRARIELGGLALVLAVSDEGYFDAADGDDADVCFSLPPGAPLLALKGIEAVIQEAHVSGPADFAEALGFVLRNLKWDGEEDLSRLVGDVLAHRLARTARAFLDWQRRAAGNAADNVVEYLREEKGVLPRGEEVGQWKDQVARLSADLDRLEARVSAFKKSA